MLAEELWASGHTVSLTCRDTQTCVLQARGEGDAPDSPSKAGTRRQPAQDEAERAQRR